MNYQQEYSQRTCAESSFSVFSSVTKPAELPACLDDTFSMIRAFLLGLGYEQSALAGVLELLAAQERHLQRRHRWLEEHFTE